MAFPIFSHSMGVVVVVVMVTKMMIIHKRKGRSESEGQTPKEWKLWGTIVEKKVLDEQIGRQKKLSLNSFATCSFSFFNFSLELHSKMKKMMIHKMMTKSRSKRFVCLTSIRFFFFFSNDLIWSLSSLSFSSFLFLSWFRRITFVSIKSHTSSSLFLKQIFEVCSCSSGSWSSSCCWVLNEQDRAWSVSLLCLIPSLLFLLLVTLSSLAKLMQYKTALQQLLYILLQVRVQVSWAQFKREGETKKFSRWIEKERKKERPPTNLRVWRMQEKKKKKSRFSFLPP